MQHILKEHPDYPSLKQLLGKYRDLYVGGEQFKQNADRYLVRRQREPGPVFLERLDRVFYENYIGSIVDWYSTTLFRREPVLHYEGASESTRAFYSAFADDCDLSGTSVTDYMRRQLTECLVTGRAYTVIDFPRVDVPVKNRADEDQAGLSRAYLCDYPADALTNWSRNAAGDFDWVVFQTRRLVSTDSETRPWAWERRWHYYDRENFEVYRQFEEAQQKPQRIDHGRHGLAHLGIVPIVECQVPSGLWLMNRAALIQLEHFNKSNALAWALTMGLFAMPVVYSDREWNQLVGESYYLLLGQNDRFGWTEPEGHVFEIAMANVDRLKEEIYRVCYVLHQAGGSLSKNSNLTGLSKLRDYTVTQEILRGYGDCAKDSLKKILKLIVLARQDDLAIDVSGLDEFDIGDFSSELQDAKELLTLGIESKTFKEQVLKKLALKFLCDVRQPIKDRIAQEIEAQS